MSKDTHDDLHVLRVLAGWEGQTVGATARDLSDAEGLDYGVVQDDLDRYRHDKLVDVEIEPITKSAFYTVNRAGLAVLDQRDGSKLGAEDDALNLDLDDEAA